ncbi:restriction endonuclease subunit S, partial [Streptococcus pneumoniae]
MYNLIQKQKNSTNDNISLTDIQNFLIPLPPLSEQTRIVEKIE